TEGSAAADNRGANLQSDNRPQRGQHCRRSHTIARLERGDPGVAIGTLADVLVVLGLLERLADLIHIRKDDLGLALAAEYGPRRGRSFAARLKKQKTRTEEKQDRQDVVDPDGASF
ncbi:MULTISPECIES: hypothetical protein, partial [unclassified Bosea (in: a-proteobacteria)]